LTTNQRGHVQKNGMQDVYCFHGTYRYATRECLEHAISSARAVLAEDEASEGDAAWMRCFVTRGTVLTVNLTSHVDRRPRATDRSRGGGPATPWPEGTPAGFSAAAVFDTLAESAIEGAASARLGDAHIDLFPSRRD
jgi:hypothetical protein